MPFFNKSKNNFIKTVPFIFTFLFLMSLLFFTTYLTTSNESTTLKAAPIRAQSLLNDGIYKDVGDNLNLNVYVQTYDNGGTLLVYTFDTVNMKVFWDDEVADNLFNGESVNPAIDEKVIFDFNTMTMTIINQGEPSTTSTSVPSTSSVTTSAPPSTTTEDPGAWKQKPIYKGIQQSNVYDMYKFANIVSSPTDGILKDIGLNLNLYVQSYDTGGTLILYTFDTSTMVALWDDHVADNFFDGYPVNPAVRERAQFDFNDNILTIINMDTGATETYETYKFADVPGGTITTTTSLTTTTITSTTSSTTSSSTVLTSSSSSTSSPTTTITSALYVVTDQIGSTSYIVITDALTDFGLTYTISDTIPSDMSSYSIVIIGDSNACYPETADYVKNYVQNGGSVILIGASPAYFCAAPGSHIDDLSYIADWFGARYYGNSGGSTSIATIVVDHPFGTDLMTGDFIHYCDGPFCAATYNPLPETQVIAKWDTGRMYSFSHTYGEGKVYYTKAPSSGENSVILINAAIGWLLE
ncbi:MAG: hypothetical protein JRI44_02405 [Deltaproteobacteria bacterium]|nr:hypothetical protein [Deltaproteobacteria bacterium]